MKRLTLLACAFILATTALAAGRHVKDDKPLAIAQGREVDLKDFLVPGKYTIFDFTSEYCPPCRAYADPLLKLHQRRPDVAVVKVDINRPEIHGIDWQSPVAVEFGLISIPQFKVFGPDGRLVAEDKVVLGPDGRLARREFPARELVDRWIGAGN
ncbi:MAG TPA: thioredoxin family protein [Lacunisphaera sp.]|jgi:thiol-disulfide isomerase/thioredoxin|nr:thioredoxin family protein [Lacunisphaera sp.]